MPSGGLQARWYVNFNTLDCYRILYCTMNEGRFDSSAHAYPLPSTARSHKHSLRHTYRGVQARI